MGRRTIRPHTRRRGFEAAADETRRKGEAAFQFTVYKLHRILLLINGCSGMTREIFISLSRSHKDGPAFHSQCREEPALLDRTEWTRGVRTVGRQRAKLVSDFSPLNM